MIEQNDSFDPALIRRIRVRMKWLIGLVLGMILVINLDHIKRIITDFLHQ